VRICLLVPYYGSLPRWLPLFLRSVEFNPGIDLFLITSEKVPSLLPANVRVVRMRLEEIERRVRDTLSPGFRMPWPYKLCDLKPFYGLIFDPLLREYTFWGYCDVDLVFGNLAPLLSARRLEDADFFSADAKVIMGSFSLYRNTPAMNGLALRLPDFQERLNSPESHVLDEGPMLTLLESSPDVRWDRPRCLAESQLTVSDRGRMVGRTTGVIGDPDEFYWSRGRTYVKAPGYGPQEVLYLHFIGLKRFYHWTRYEAGVVYDEFALSAAGFQPWRRPPTFWDRVDCACRGSVLSRVGRVRGAAAASLTTARRQKLKGTMASVERWWRG
jgi:hypothetical protein